VLPGRSAGEVFVLTQEEVNKVLSYSLKPYWNIFVNKSSTIEFLHENCHKIYTSLKSYLGTPLQDKQLHMN
jgi:hypothetical protein